MLILNMKKIIFLDLDGTLVGRKDGHSYIPESAKEAIIRARLNGHLIYYCTGRSRSDVDGVSNLIDIDGIVGGSGSYVLVGDTQILSRHMNIDIVHKIKKFLDDNGVFYWIETSDGVFFKDENTKYVFKELADIGVMGKTFYNIIKDYDSNCLNIANKIVFHSKTLTYDEIYKEIGNICEMVPMSYWENNWQAEGEISGKGITKGSAITYLLDYLKIDKKDAIGIGDSYNDIPMLENVGTKVVMGNGEEDVKKIADFVTDSLENDGIYNTFVKLNLI